MGRTCRRIASRTGPYFAPKFIRWRLLYTNGRLNFRCAIFVSNGQSSTPAQSALARFISPAGISARDRNNSASQIGAGMARSCAITSRPSDGRRWTISPRSPIQLHRIRSMVTKSPLCLMAALFNLGMDLLGCLKIEAEFPGRIIE